ncbi:regulatory helix-turn-helix LysR family protein [Roseateles toxinivorans]|uniref:Regulatory helix-turn-helix LysR family protein n=1 Tax=Roseateles toxinivorans TaxID=270368 RepID=A0A4R6QK42_9BURK|nr:regulatory helix-turn-helix LysR family protein [Roseateles toxinivorans]
MSTEDQLKGIATFVKVAESGSFALAAQQLRQTRSAVAKSIARLEARLEVRLFQRTTRQQSLTAAYFSDRGRLFQADRGRQN